jgi:outer membrane protein TolC
MVQDLDSQAPIQTAFGQKWISTAGVSLTQVLINRFLLVKSRKTTREFYQLNDQLTEEQVIENVANNYYQVYVLRQN